MPQNTAVQDDDDDDDALPGYDLNDAIARKDGRTIMKPDSFIVFIDRITYNARHLAMTFVPISRLRAVTSQTVRTCTTVCRFVLTFS